MGFPADTPATIRRDIAIILVKLLIAFAMMVPLEDVHPLQSGVFRLKHPSDRRPGLPRERVWVFWPRFLWQAAYKQVVLAGMIARLLVLKASIARDPDARADVDSALTPVGDDDYVTLDLLTKTTGSGAALAHIRKVAAFTGASRPN